MGICCCRTENPCDNLEERNGLLKDDSKGTVPCDDRGVVGSCGPDRADEVRKSADEAPVRVEEKAAAVQLKKSSVNGETKVNNAQENGPLPREVAPAAIHSPGEKQEDASGVQDKDVEGSLDSGGQADLLQRTFDSVDTGISSAPWEVRPETSAVTAEAMAPSVEDRIPVGLAPPAEEANPPHIKTNTTTPDTNQTDDGDASELTVGHAATDPSAEISQNNEMVSAPNTQPTAAEGQVLSITVVSQEINSEPLVVTADPECSSAREDYEPEDIQGHAASDLSGLESAGVDHSGEERDSANTVSEPATTSRTAASESPKPTKDDEPQLATGSNAAAPSEKVKQDAGEESLPQAQNKGDVPKVKETEEGEGEVAAAAAAAARAPAEAEEDAEIEEASEEEQQVAESTLTHDAETADSERKDSSDGDLTRSEDDLYRGAEELSASQGDTLGPPAALETTPVSKVEDRCSLDPAVDILLYSEREWRGNTAKSVLIRKGYKEMSQRFGGVRRVRGDNYCALRATLFQVLSHTTQLPAWLQDQDVSLLPQELEAQEGLISQWTFPGRWPQGDGGRDVTQQLKGCMELLQNKWREAAGCSTAAERQRLCQSVFQGGEEELGLLEALKLLMLGRAAELHARMRDGADVPLFCWLLFARDSSDSPRSFLANHLSHVGISAGLEQVEMFLLGYALHCTIQVYRLYKADTEEFVTYYPDDHKDEWPSVCLVTEDDRHYNVPVEEAAAEALEELASS